MIWDTPLIIVLITCPTTGAHYNEKLVLEDMAKQFNLSRSYLSKKFKSVTGFGFKEYIINVRIKHACELLLNTNKSITTIAFECGFNDSNYFGDAFRRTKGVSPNKYRRNQERIWFILLIFDILPA